MNLVIGSDGLLGRTLLALLPAAVGTTRRRDDETRRVLFDLTDDPRILPPCEIAYLCAGTKGFRENEGNEAAFKADVDGNIRIASYLLRRGTFVVFVSAEGVQWAGHTAYCRNRLLVEMALIMQPNVAIVRPGRFAGGNVAALAKLCVDVGLNRSEGLHRWSDHDWV